MMHWLSFFIGILIGWGVEWLIDYFYCRRRLGDDNGAETDLSERLEKALGTLQQMRIDLYDAQTSAKADLAQLNLQLAEAQGEIASLRARLATAEMHSQNDGDAQSLGWPVQAASLDQAEETVSAVFGPTAEESNILERFDLEPVEGS